ncbi:hypothetical protein HanPI659440_Chr09g0354231 [Helianthus annuus]|nr:hypothetical protein HanIR_Chr09g0442491 [Helianthus annuus]KAJ0755109.1 hypothetical protein HanPI659440_Chr09g0354231 [Helianthus annuus]
MLKTFMEEQVCTIATRRCSSWETGILALHIAWRCHTLIFPRITGGPGGEYRDVVDIIIVNNHSLMHSGSLKVIYYKPNESNMSITNGM